MNDDGSNQRLLLGWASVPGMDSLKGAGVAQNGTTLAFDGETNGACEINCQGVYTLAGGVLRRLSGGPRPCTGTTNSCATYDTHPTVAPDGEVLFAKNFRIVK